MENEGVRFFDWLLLVGVIVAIAGGVMVTVSYFRNRRTMGKWQSVGLLLGALGLVLVIVAGILMRLQP